MIISMKRFDSQKFRAERIKKGLTQQMLSFGVLMKHGRTISTISIGKWELGKSNPALDNLALVCDFMGNTTDHFMTERGEK